MLKLIKISNTLDLIARHFIQEIKSIFSDKGAILILMGAMIIYPIVYSIGYYNEVLTQIKIGVVDLDRSELSRKYTRMLDATQDIDVTLKPCSLLEAESHFMHNQIEGVIVIPKGFEGDIMKNAPTNVAVYADASYFLKYKNVYMAASVVNSYFNANVSMVRYIVEGKSFNQAKAAIDPLPVYQHVLYNPSLGYASYLMPGLILIILQQTLLIGIGILGGSFSESKASPFLSVGLNRRREVIPYLIGKSGAYIMVSMINIIFGVVLVHHWFGYPDKASLLQILMLLLPFIVAVTFLGIGIATLFKHRESAIVFMVFLSPIVLFLSGLSWPSQAMPGWIVLLSKIIPSTTVVPAYLRLRTMGVDFVNIKSDVVFLYSQAAIYVILTVAYFLIRIKYARKKMN